MSMCRVFSCVVLFAMTSAFSLKNSISLCPASFRIPRPNMSSLVAQTVKHLSTMQETWVRSLGREDSLEKEMATHSSTLAWKIPWTAELGAGHCPCGRKELSTREWLHFHFHIFTWHTPSCLQILAPISLFQEISLKKSNPSLNIFFLLSSKVLSPSDK